MASNAGYPLSAASIRWVHNSMPVRESTRGEKGKGRESNRGAQVGRGCDNAELLHRPPSDLPPTLHSSRAAHTQTPEHVCKQQQQEADETHWPFTAPPFLSSPRLPIHSVSSSKHKHKHKQSATRPERHSLELESLRISS